MRIYDLDWLFFPSYSIPFNELFPQIQNYDQFPNSMHQFKFSKQKTSLHYVRTNTNAIPIFSKNIYYAKPIFYWF